MSYGKFIFKDYDFNRSSKELTLIYSLDNAVSFTETYRFNFDFVDSIDEQALDRAIQGLFFMAGVSYYKTYLPKQIIIEKGQLDTKNAQFFSKTYQRGLGEFFYVNELDPKTEVMFVSNSSELAIPALANRSGLLIGLGGGKDSLVSIELLRNDTDVVTWSLGHEPQLKPLVQKIGLSHMQIERTWDRTLLIHNDQGAYNGHIPISAIFAFVGVIVAVLAGKKDIVVSNEHAANEPNLTYKGVAINHQYSKSQEFESDFQTYLRRNFGESVRYYSSLRPFSELKIAEVFSKHCFDKYQNVFSSCNRAFTHDSKGMYWCGKCAKCAFTFLILTPFVTRMDLEKLWSKNLLLDLGLENTYKELLGISGTKPLDCVGEIAETRAAMRIAQEKYPELSKYEFVLDEFDYNTLYGHEIPEEIFTKITARLVL